MNLEFLTQSFRHAFSRPRAWMQAGIFAFLILSAMIFLLNSVTLSAVWGTQDFTVIQKISITFATYSFFFSGFDPVHQMAAAVLILLASVHAVLFLSYIRKEWKLRRQAGVGLFALVFGMLGFGCTACGSIILSSIFGVSATAAFLSKLPFAGNEFLLIGIAVMSASLVWTSYQISVSGTCRVP